MVLFLYGFEQLFEHVSGFAASHALVEGLGLGYTSTFLLCVKGNFFLEKLGICLVFVLRYYLDLLKLGVLLEAVTEGTAALLGPELLVILGLLENYLL